MRKPTKILEVNFEAILPDLEKPGETIRIPIDTGITILEMINTLRDLSETSFAIELDYGLKIKTDFLKFSSEITTPVSQQNSSVSAVIN